MSLERYDILRRDIHSGDLIEWGSHTFLGWLIRRFTGRDVNHTSLALELSFFKVLEHRRFILEALELGIRVNLLSMRMERFKGEVYHIKLRPEYNHLRDAIAGWALCQIGKKYDYPSLIRQAIGKVNLDAKKYFCSEYAYAAYKEVGIIPEGGKVPRPGEFGDFGIHETERIRLM